ncbi:hypothetical protein JCM30204_12900 [Dysgonomonas termitidis]
MILGFFSGRPVHPTKDSTDKNKIEFFIGIMYILYRIYICKYNLFGTDKIENMCNLPY